MAAPDVVDKLEVTSPRGEGSTGSMSIWDNWPKGYVWRSEMGGYVTEAQAAAEMRRRWKRFVMVGPVEIGVDRNPDYRPLKVGTWWPLGTCAACPLFLARPVAAAPETLRAGLST